MGLAPRIVTEIFALLDDLRGEGIAMLLVEQNARKALALASRGYVLDNGRVALEGPAAELAASPAIVDAYLGASRQTGSAA
jgi:branched-chain amino acid transport system ATP-binding protein